MKSTTPAQYGRKVCCSRGKRRRAPHGRRGEQREKIEMTNTEPIRVLHVLGKLNMGGAESRIMDLYRHIDRDKIQFDFLVHYGVSKAACGGDDSTENLLRLRPKEFFDDEITALGGRIYVLPRFDGRNLLRYRKAAGAFFAGHHEFAAVEGHMTSMASVYLPLAKAAGVPLTIAHARSAGVDPGLRGLATRWLRRPLPKRCDCMLACSRPAGISVFGEKACREGRVQFMPNAVDLSAFAFNAEAEQNRVLLRKQFGFPDGASVIGHVGRFDPVKNQAFLLPVLLKLREDYPERDFRLLLIGGGVNMGDVEAKARERGLSDAVVFAGERAPAETAKLYAAMDLFTLPSLYEGLPGTVIEAQAAGLPCVISDSITDEVCITEEVLQSRITDAGTFAKDLAAMQVMTAAPRQQRSLEAREKLSAAGYEVSAAAKRLQAWYLRGGRGTI